MNYTEIDNKICSIDKKIDVLSAIKPANLNQEKEKVFADNNYNPQFEYKKLSFDPAELMEELSSIKFDDSTLSKIFKAKKDEILKKIDLCESIGKPNFTQKSINRYSKPKKKSINLAKKELCKIRFEKESNKLGYSMVKEILQSRLEQYNLSWKVKVVNSLADEATAEKEDTLFLRKDVLISKQRLMTMIRHDIDCHILKAENGKYQPFKIFNRGFPGYLATEEGLAIHMVNELGIKTRKIFFPQIRVILTDIALSASFSDIFKEALRYGFTEENAWNLCSRIKRGLKDTSKQGAFTKDAIYYPNSLRIKNFLRNNPIEDLYYGKVSLEFLDEVRNMGGLKKPRYLPLPLDISFVEQFL